MSKIKSITAYEIIASGGFPSLETEVTLEDGTRSRASVPYGASAGSYEAFVLLDNDPHRFLGKGMLRAVDNVNQIIAGSLIGKEADGQAAIDQLLIAMDGTDNKSKLGANAILAVSMAVARASALSHGQELYEYLIDQFGLSQPSFLPMPMVVSIEGGKHAHESTDIQEYCLLADQFDTVKEALRAVLETYHQLGQLLAKQGYSSNVGNEGAFAPNGIKSNTLPLELLTQAINETGYQDRLHLALDAAANEFCQDGQYHLRAENRTLSAHQLANLYQDWIQKFPLKSIEDPFMENDFAAFASLKKTLDENQVLLIGDDLTVTNTKRLQKAIDEQSISAILIKLNQIGTVSETIQCCQLANLQNLATIPSHRGGGETNDDFMIDLAVAVGSKFVKVGPTRGERVSKYNRLLAIERKLG